MLGSFVSCPLAGCEFVDDTLDLHIQLCVDGHYVESLNPRHILFDDEEYL